MDEEKLHKLIQNTLIRDFRQLVRSLSDKIDLIEQEFNKQNNKESEEEN